MFESDTKESIVSSSDGLNELPEKENLVGFFALLLEVDKRLKDKTNL